MAVKPLYVLARSVAHYLDQPQVINQTGRFVQKYGLYGALGAKAAYDVASAKPENRQGVLLQDGAVLLPTTLTTKFGLNVLSEEVEAMPIVSRSIQQQYPKLSPILSRQELQRQTISLYQNRRAITRLVPVRAKFSFQEIKRVIEHIMSVNRNKLTASNHLNQIFPLPMDDGSAISKILGQLARFKLPKSEYFNLLAKDKMVKFFGVGGLIVVGGLAGGLIHDELIGKKDKKARIDKVKEGIFQFIANIALCAVGASIGITVADGLKLQEKAIRYPNKAMAYRGTRFGLILSGLSLGILGGGYIANWVGRKFVNPFFEWQEKKNYGYTFSQSLKDAKPCSDRKIEFWDAILHLDDLPTALALAGVQIFTPFIPLFFAMSGYRTGIGYRNNDTNDDDDDDDKDDNIKPCPDKTWPVQPNYSYITNPRLQVATLSPQKLPQYAVVPPGFGY